MRKLQNEQEHSIIKIRLDRSTEFGNNIITQFCNKMRISHEILAARTPQQNRVVDRIKRTLKEVGKTMLAEAELPRRFWTEAIKHCLLHSK